MNKSTITNQANFLQEHQFFSIATVRILGYGLISLALIDFINIVIPPQLMNPTWEFQTIGLLIDRIPLTLLGMVFVFYGTKECRRIVETKLLKGLSWLCLGLAIFLIITFPLNIVNGFRIYYGNSSQVNLQVANKVENINNFQSDLQSAQTLDEIGNALGKQSKKQVRLSPDLNKEEFKSNILENLADNQNQIKSQAKQINSQQKSMLLKKCIKVNLGALISAFIFFFIWKETNWARMTYEGEE